jgi:5'(3')-deoxyribonucleotidase
MLSTTSNLRQYSISTDGDSENVTNQRCPEYALNWDHSSNCRHWRQGHDYFLGNGENITDNIELRKILSEKLARGTLPSKIVFCDLDGVLADFEQGVVNRFKKRPDELKPGLMWGLINKSSAFFETLPWMPKGRELWEQIKQYDPIILTGTPRSSNAEEQKRRWCARELGPHIHVITCATKDKPDFCITNAVLIDDRSDNLNEWNSRGGKFILYDEEFTDKVIERIHRYLETDPGLCTP